MLGSVLNVLALASLGLAYAFTAHYLLGKRKADRAYIATLDAEGEQAQALSRRYWALESARRRSGLSVFACLLVATFLPLMAPEVEPAVSVIGLVGGTAAVLLVSIAASLRKGQLEDLRMAHAADRLKRETGFTGLR